MKSRKNKKMRRILISFFLALLITGIYYVRDNTDLLNNVQSVQKQEEKKINSYNIDNIPKYSGKPYVFLNDNNPIFDDNDKKTESFETYSNLDDLGRCGVAYANISKETMPTEERGRIGMIKPSGWHTIKYDFIDGKYLYNRCHLIGYQLTGENANEKNLITCTRFMNASTMLEFENKVADYVKDTDNHVLYRVTPIFDGENLLSNGVQMEAFSVEDNGKGIRFNVFIYNVQEGVSINYETGDSKLSE